LGISRRTYTGYQIQDKILPALFLSGLVMGQEPDRIPGGAGPLL
jgi:hypothetical protein